MHGEQLDVYGTIKRERGELNALRVQSILCAIFHAAELFKMRKIIKKESSSTLKKLLSVA
jgi:hypothetical protein